MMSLKQKYENYLQKKTEYEKQMFLYENKEKELREKVIESVKALDVESIKTLGYDLTVDESKLNETDYLLQIINEVKYIRDQIESRGRDILRNY